MPSSAVGLQTAKTWVHQLKLDELPTSLVRDMFRDVTSDDRAVVDRESNPCLAIDDAAGAGKVVAWEGGWDVKDGRSYFMRDANVRGKKIIFQSLDK